MTGQSPEKTKPGEDKHTDPPPTPPEDRVAYRIAIGAIALTLVTFVVGAAVIAAGGKSVPAQYWATGSALAGALLGMLAPLPVTRKSRPSPFLLGLLFVFGASLGFAIGYESTALEAVSAAVGGALLGLLVPSPWGLSPEPISPSQGGRGNRGKTDGDHEPTPGLPVWAVMAALAILLVLLTVIVLLSLLWVHATSQGAKNFHYGSLGLLVLTVAAGAVAATMRSGKAKERWVAAAIVGALLTFMVNTASGFVLDRATKHPVPTDCVAFFVEVDQLAATEPRAIVMKATQTDPRATDCKPSVSVLLNRVIKRRVPTDCVAFFVQIDQLAEDERRAIVMQAIRNDPRAMVCKPPLGLLGKK